MPIIDQQRRLREIARIRTGDQVPTGNGKMRPRKLETFRITSRDRRFIEAAAAKYGGTVEPWAAPDGDQWQVLTEARELPVIVPPTDMAFSQYYELWNAGGCVRRCDGYREEKTDGPCLCDPDPKKRECATVTQLNVILYELPGMGVCRLVTHSYYAAEELIAAVEYVATTFTAGGRILPAKLFIEQRSRKKLVGEKSQTLRYSVPALDIPVTFGELQSGLNLQTRVGASFVPVPELPSAPVGTIAEQVTNVGREQRPRSNAAQPIPATGRRPRTALEIVEGGGTGDTTVDVEGSPAAAPASLEPSPTAALPLPSTYDTWTARDLHAECVRRGLGGTGTKADLIVRLIEADLVNAEADLVEAVGRHPAAAADEGLRDREPRVPPFDPDDPDMQPFTLGDSA